MIRVNKLDGAAILPTRAHPTDAGLDLYALKSTTLWIDREVVKVRTGISMEIPTGYYGKLFDRSSLGSKGIIITAGVIDNTYRGEIIVCMYNLGRINYHINAGDKIAQIVIQPCSLDGVIEVEELSNTGRSINGFGSTGK